MIIGLWAKRREFGAVASVLLLSAKGLLDASVRPKSCLFLLFRQWGCRLLLKMESLQLFNVSKTPLGARFDRTLPPPWIRPAPLFSLRCVFDAASLHLSQTLPAQWFYFHCSLWEAVRWSANQWIVGHMRRPVRPWHRDNCSLVSLA